MSSVGRSARIIDSNVKFFVCVSPPTGATGISKSALADAIYAAVGDGSAQHLGSVVNVVEGAVLGSGAFIDQDETITAGEQYRDMGKTLYLQKNGVNEYIFKLVQKVDNADAEGATIADEPIYACVWSASGSDLSNLARTG